MPPWGPKPAKAPKSLPWLVRLKKAVWWKVPMGMTINEIIFGIGGGIKGDKDIKGVQMGGPSGGCIPKNLLDTPVDYESITKVGAIMGLRRYDRLWMKPPAWWIWPASFWILPKRKAAANAFTAALGTKQMLQILNRIVDGNGREGDIELLGRIGKRDHCRFALRLRSGAPPTPP